MMIEPGLLNVKSRHDEARECRLVELCLILFMFLFVGTAVVGAYLLTPEDSWNSDKAANAAVQLYERLHLQSR